VQFNINSFRQIGLPLGGARPSLFQIRINDIQAITNQSNGVQLSYLTATASLPSSDLQLVEVPYFGRRIKLAGEREYRDWVVTIMNDEDFDMRDLLEFWSNMINTAITNIQNTTTSAPANYKSEGTEVLQYGKVGPGSDAGIIRAYEFHGLFPLRISDIRLDWSQGNQIETYDVQFAYDYWTPLPLGSSIPSYNGDEGDTNTGTALAVASG
jgi:hypothetical protein